MGRDPRDSPVPYPYQDTHTKIRKGIHKSLIDIYVMNTRIPRFIRGQYEKINSTYYKENLSINFHHGKGWIWRTRTGQKIGVLLTNEKEIFDHHVDCEFEFYSEGMSEFFTSSVLAVENNSDLSPGSLIFIQEPSLKSYMNGFYMEVRRSDKIRNLKTTTV